MLNAQTAQRHFQECLARKGLKISRQRQVIIDVFFAANRHVSVDELLSSARQVDARVSQATVYRTLRVLEDCGLADARHFMDGQTRYEMGEQEGAHHDHLICTLCGKIEEFCEPRIEELQHEVARASGFVMTRHKMELYGTCADCRSKTA